MSKSGLHASFVVRRRDGFEVDVELTATPGTTIALLGPNGAGKTTVVSAVAGLLQIDSGSVVLDEVVLDDPNRDVFVSPEERNIGIVFQDYLLFPHMSALENVAFGPRSRGLGREEARGRAETWIERLGLSGLERRPTGTLSGGQAQRVAMARALAMEPELLLLDEPLAALDVTARGSVRHLLAEHLEEFSGPRVLITHDPVEASLLADEIYILEAGSITQVGTADEISIRPRTRFAADFAGLNLFAGTAHEGAVEVAGHLLHLAEAEDGPVLVTIHPHSISVHTRAPSGSPRNAWPTRIERIEPLGPRVRILTGGPLPLTVEVTRSASEELNLSEGGEIWVAMKATEISVQSDRP